MLIKKVCVEDWEVVEIGVEVKDVHFQHCKANQTSMLYKSSLKNY